MMPAPHPVQILDYDGAESIDPTWRKIVKMTENVGVMASLLMMLHIGQPILSSLAAFPFHGRFGPYEFEVALSWTWFFFATLLLMGSLGSHYARRGLYRLFLIGAAGCAIVPACVLVWTLVHDLPNYRSPYFARWMGDMARNYATFSLISAFLFWLMRRPQARRCFNRPPRQAVTSPRA